MGDYTKEQIDAIIEENKRLKEEKESKTESSVANIKSMTEEKEKLLQIELQLADLRGDSLDKMRLAQELMDDMTKSEMDAFKAGEAGQQAMAEKYGLSIEMLQDLVDLHEDLGEVGIAGYKAMKGPAEDAAVKMGLVSKKADGILGGIVKIGKLAQDPKGLKGMAMALKDTLKPTRIFASLILKIGESTLKAIMATDKATAAFAKTTGLGRMHTAGISKLGTTHANLGIDVALAGKAFTAAQENMSGFNNMSEATQQKVGLTTAMLEKLGVGAETGTKMMEDFSKRLGMTGAEASDMTRDLALSAKGLGMSMKKFVSAFNSANKSLAVYGREGVKVFKNVAAAARAAGVETEALLGLAGKFDTFSDAADTTGKLNAILGTQISAMDMLTMKEDERIEHLLRSMQASGKQFKDMDRFTQKAVAQAAGITDMAQANKIFGMSFKDYKNNQRAMAATEKGQEEANKRMKEAMSITEALKAIMQEFVIKGIGPHVDMIKDGAVALADFIHWLMDGHGALVMFGAGLAGIAIILSPLLGLFKLFGGNMHFVGRSIAKVLGWLWAKIVALKVGKVAQEEANEAQEESNDLASGGTEGMLNMAKAVMFLGIGIGIAAAGMALFAWAFGNLDYGKMAATAVMIVIMGYGFFQMAAGLGTLGAVSATVAPFILAIGVAIFLVGAGMALFAFGMGYMIEQLVALAKVGWVSVGVLVGLAIAMYGIAAAAAVMANPMSLIGLYILWELMEEMTLQAQAQATMATAVGGAIGGMGDIATQMKEAVTKFAELASADFFSVFAGLYFGIRAFMSALDLDSQYGVKVSHTLENLALIATGKSAKSLDGGTGSAIVAAINRMATKEEKTNLKITIDKDHIQQAMRDGYFEIRAE